jgi:hypothetical protein
MRKKNNKNVDPNYTDAARCINRYDNYVFLISSRHDIHEFDEDDFDFF